MTSNSKPRLHVFRQDVARRQTVMVPVYRVSPEMVNAIRRREGTTGVQYWNDMATNGVINRSARRMTVEEAFPRLHVGSHYETNKHSSKHPTKVTSHGDRVISAEPKKAMVTDFRSLQTRDTPKTVQADPSRNYQMYSAKVRYIDVGTPETNLAATPRRSKRKESKLENFEKQNGQANKQSNDHTTSKSEISNFFTSSQSNGHVSNGHVEGMLPSYRVEKQPQVDKTDFHKSKRRTAWSEMTHLGVNGSIGKISEPTFHKLGMNHTFRIPRPKATVSSSRNINLTASKKRAVSFGQDKVYEYTPLEPVNNYPIEEELL